MVAMKRSRRCEAWREWVAGFAPSLFLIAALGLASGCGVFRSYNREMVYARGAFAVGDFEAARASITKRMKGPDGRNEKRLNPWLELGIVEHTAGSYSGSTNALHRARDIVRDYEKRAVVSASEVAGQAATLVVNEKAQPYTGESFEKVLIHTFLALNYLMSGDWDGARVEARRGWQRQMEIEKDESEKLAKAREEARGGKQPIDSNAVEAAVAQAYADQNVIASRVANAYQNAFTHYVAAVVYGAMREHNETYVELRRAQALRPRAACLGPFLIETANDGGFHEDLEKWEAVFGLSTDDVLAERASYPAELIVLFENGWAPQKQQITVPIPTPVGLVTLAIPKNEPMPGAARSLIVEAVDLRVATDLMGDVEAQAVRALRDRMPIYVIKMIIRLTARTLAEREMKQKAQEEGGQAGAILAMVAFSAANVALEQADLRAWSLLPRDLQAARLRLPEGPTQIRLQLEGGGGFGDCVTLNLRTDRPNVILARSTGSGLFIQTNAQ